MKKILNTIFVLFMVAVSTLAKDDIVPHYDITGAGSGSEGTILVKVYIYANNVSDDDLKRVAVHGVVFRGCSGNQSKVRQPAMTSPASETENKEFYKAFFAEDGDCLNFANIISGSYDRIKTPKGYKQGAILQVDKRALRQYLEKAGVIRSLNNGF